jgi:hypothetical protein
MPVYRQHEFVANIESAHLRYFDEFIKGWKSAADLLAAGLFPNAKEVSESMGAFAAVRRHFNGWSRKNERIQVVVVADGHRPRTAALFAFRTVWTCHAVDPLLRPIEYGFNRVYCHKQQIEDFSLVSDHPVLLVAVHSHARLDAALKSIKAPHIGVVAIPCCVNQQLSKEPDIAYEDMGIWSPQRTVKVWYAAERMGQP